MPSKQSVSPNRPLAVEIPSGLEATMTNGTEGKVLPSKEVAASATEADIKFGERTAFIPMTCQERQVLERLEAGLQSAASLWQDSLQQQEHDRLLSSALHHWQAPAPAGIDNSWVWEVGRWNTQFSLPLALELRRLDPGTMSDSDQLVALSTCLRNRQIELAKKLASAAASTAASVPSGDGGGSRTNSSGGSGVGGVAKKKATPTPTASLEDLDDEPCLCQIRWGLAPDTEAAKRRQLEKLEEEHRSPPPPQLTHPKRHLQQHQNQNQHQHQHHHLHQQHHQVPQRAPLVSGGHMRPIVKTSHLRDQNAEVQQVPAGDDAGYSSQSCSPGSRGIEGGSFISDLLAASTYGGRSWAD